MEGHIIICLEGFVAQCDKIKAAAGLAFVDPDTAFLHDKLGLALRQMGRGPVDVIALSLPFSASSRSRTVPPRKRCPPAVAARATTSALPCGW